MKLASGWGMSPMGLSECVCECERERYMNQIVIDVNTVLHGSILSTTGVG